MHLNANTASRLAGETVALQMHDSRFRAGKIIHIILEALIAIFVNDYLPQRVLQSPYEI